MARGSKRSSERVSLKLLQILQDEGSSYRFLRDQDRDSSAIYGSNSKAMDRVGTYKDGKLKLSEETGLLLQDQDGLAISGDVRNSWVGVSALQALFVKEHNAVCDALKDLYRHARLVTSAVIAKIHTIDWTVELLKTDTLLAGMRTNWYGILGKKFKDSFGHVGSSILGGLVGMKKPQNHGVPYSITEDFTSVYRMHSLLPDQLELRDIDVVPGTNKSLPLIEEVSFGKLLGPKGEQTMSHIGFTKLMVSMGHQASGALELMNYPVWLRDLSSSSSLSSVQFSHPTASLQTKMGAFKVVKIAIPTERDVQPKSHQIMLWATNKEGGEEDATTARWRKKIGGEGYLVEMTTASTSEMRKKTRRWLRKKTRRSSGRYNEFRRSMFMIPIKKWEDLTDDKEAIEALEDVYGGNVEELDLLVGLMAEKKIKGFAISETAFNIFVIMATRRLEADRFFTSDFNEMTYTKKGLEWVNTTESLKDVFDRHYPEMTDRWMNSESAFSVWDSPPVAKNPIPLYLRDKKKQWSPAEVKVVSSSCLLLNRKLNTLSMLPGPMARLKQAKEEAEKEIAEYKAKTEQDFQRKLEETSGDSGANVKRLEQETDAKIEQLKNEASRISNDVVEMLLKHVTTVKN
ncbi:hypothetical protein HID58_073892 [Brassica napus]|uniref:Uncharacterized protein n=1 Tax=Brassica napus TaxID=3708 RepID=A0ABQ7YF77_BRANA|nr:hypothetical protein HID58_073892 [Brassica napus]